MPETGVVKWFDSRETKRFGFLKLESGEEIFFHFNDGRHSEVRDGQVQLSEGATIVYQGKTRRLRQPKPDDVILFTRSWGSRGFKAAPWGYKASWEICEQWILDHQEEIAQRRAVKEETLANRPIYRALSTMNAVGKDPGEPKVLWEGQDLAEALRKFPLPTGRQSPGSDPMLNYSSDSDNIFEIHRWWERRQPPDGEWERCDDPRPLTGTLRTLEQINRR